MQPSVPSVGMMIKRGSIAIPSRPLTLPTTNTRQPLVNEPVLSDQLGKLVREAINRLEASSSFEQFIAQSQGESDFNPKVGQLDHPAAALLDNYRLHGTTLVSTEPP